VFWAELYPDIFCAELYPDIFYAELHPDIFCAELYPDIFCAELYPDTFCTELYPDIFCSGTLSKSDDKVEDKRQSFSGDVNYGCHCTSLRTTHRSSTTFYEAVLCSIWRKSEELFSRWS
jgi:hypothetical protein